MQQVTISLLSWYDKEKRSLPWRAEGGDASDPYAVWMSEIMLQQTTVATVKGYFEKFLTLWPTVEDLAAARQEDVLKAWAGLGYYARARNLHKCAQVVAADHGGHFPRDYEGLKALPGIGDYTAAAVAAIAFGDSTAPVVDGNIERFISRLHTIEDQLPKAKPAIKTATKKLTPTDRPGDFAQAMMDLGSSICTPKSPKCLLCPVHSHCAAHKAGTAESFPRKAPKKPKPTRRSVAFAALHDGHIFLERRGQKDMLGGMLGLPHSPWVPRDTIPDLDEAIGDSPSALEADTYTPLPSIATHTFTHFHLETRVYRTNLTQKINRENGEWVPIKTIKDAGLPTVFMKMVAAIKD